jgi:UrcA family protein
VTREVRDESVVARDDFDAHAHTKGGLDASYGGIVKITQNRRFNMKRNNVVFGMIAGCLLGALGVGTASAATPAELPSIVIKYDPQSLASDEGARALYQRLVKASEQVCPATGEDLLSLNAARRCSRQVLEHAVREINDSRLAALYAGSARRG